MEVDVRCPYCGEPTVVVVDEAGGHTIEDCTVCCRPIDVFTIIDVDGQPQVEVSRQDE